MSSITSEEAKELTVPLKKPDHLPAVPDHRVNYKRRPAPAPQHKTDCCKQFLIFLSAIFCISTLTLVGILLWREFSHKECDNSPVPVHEQFPGYFRTHEQQEALEDLVFKKQTYYPVNYSVAMGYECDTKCSAYNSVNSSKGIQLLTNDVCCLRDVRYVMLKNLSNLAGKERKIVQGNSTFQFFRVETCSQNSGCRGCQCVQTGRLITAVYESQVEGPEAGTQTKYNLDWFLLPDNCHCRVLT
ncbi:uncharacterized protein LOC135464807 [Liolophura sinensis]|uniref:uncharacterized protein LOC135464807 n=1 Tax=Liolophura sinensis TaxID=3198878 RepID=UPI003158A1BF